MDQSGAKTNSVDQSGSVMYSKKLRRSVVIPCLETPDVGILTGPSTSTPTGPGESVNSPNVNIEVEANETNRSSDSSSCSLLNRAIDASRAECETFWWRNLKIHSLLAIQTFGKEIKRKIVNDFIPGSKRPKHSDLCEEFGVLAIGAVSILCWWNFHVFRWE